ncbi:uncharacterized protein LOC142225698 [Haematobia irritans]|uniref:uncharacterized protein LOC142225698 n=1 Tax=Haematobia irritans TaxID=7368 RepID=UPI003F50A99C
MENMREIVKTLPDYEDDVPMSDEEREILENDVAPVLREPLPAIKQVPDVGMTPVVASSQEVVPAQRVIPPSGADTAPAEVSATKAAESSSSPTGTAQRNSDSSPKLHLNNCVLCRRKHNLRSCRRFLKMRLEQRLRTVVLHRVCSNCLGRSHMRSTCNSRERCRECGESHHTLLHSFDQQQRPSAPSSDFSKRKSKSSSSVNSSAYCITNTAPISGPMLVLQPTVTLGPTIVLLLVLPDRRIPVRAVLDPCAGYSMICSSLALSLRLVSAMTSHDAFCPLVAVSRHNAESKLVFSARVTDLTRVVTPSSSAPDTIREHFECLQLADPRFYRPSGVGLVLGPDVYARVLKTQIFSSPGFPLAQLTMFGWIVSGQCQP